MPQIQPSATGVAVRASVLAVSVLLSANNAMAQNAALDAASNMEARELQAAAAAAQRDAAKYYSVVFPGVVKDSRTGLQWMRCSLGQDWDEKSKTCNGNVRDYGWQAALDIADKINRAGGYAGVTDWRLPTLRELQSLRYCANGFHSDTVNSELKDGKDVVPYRCAGGYLSPTIAQTVFPNTGSYYWSSTIYSADPYYAWFVLFSDGQNWYFPRGYQHAVRLVR